MERGEYPVVTAKNTPYRYYLKSYGEAVYIEDDSGKKQQGGSNEIQDIQITFSEIEWDQEEAKVTINTNNTDVNNIFQYKVTNIDDIETEWIDIEGNSKEILGLQDGNKVVARVININEDGETTVKAVNSINIMRETNDYEMKVYELDIGMDYIAVGVGINNLAEMPEEVEYTYYIKKSSEKDYREVEKIYSDAYEFLDLEIDTKYDIKVVTQNVKGYIIEGKVTLKTNSEEEEQNKLKDKGDNPSSGGGSTDGTGSTGGTDSTGGYDATDGEPTYEWSTGSYATLTGMVYFRNGKWNPEVGNYSLELFRYKKNCKIQYQINTKDENSWITVESGTYLNNLKHGDILYARLTDGTHYGIKTYIKKIVDRVNPTVNIRMLEYSEGIIRVEVSDAKDLQSGLEKPIQYEYELRRWNGSTYETTNLGKTQETTKTVTDLSTGYYAVRVKIKDRSGREYVRGTNLHNVKGKSHLLTYNANGGTGGPGSKVVYEGQKISLSTTKPTKNGYKFAGWSADGTANTTVYPAGRSYEIGKSDITLYAVWQPKEYTMSVGSITTSGCTVSISMSQTDRNNVQTIRYYVNDSLSGNYYTTNNVITCIPNGASRYIWTEAVFNDGYVLRSKNYKIVRAAHSHEYNCYEHNYLNTSNYGFSSYPTSEADPYESVVACPLCTSCHTYYDDQRYSWISSSGFWWGYRTDGTEENADFYHYNVCEKIGVTFDLIYWTTKEYKCYWKYCSRCKTLDDGQMSNYMDIKSGYSATFRHCHYTADDKLTCTKPLSGAQTNYYF